MSANSTFDVAAAHYLLLYQAKTSIVTETYLLQSVMPVIGALLLPQVHDGSLAPYVSGRLAEGRSHKTINLALGVVRRDREPGGRQLAGRERPHLAGTAPKITLLPLVGHQREPQPITWADQRTLLPKLQHHLSRMALFVLNTGVRDDVVCSLRWDWEIRIPELGISVFEVPRQHVKGKKRSKIVVCNSVAQSVVGSVRGMHAALEKVKDDNGRWNKSLLTLRREQEAARGESSPPKVPQQEKTA